MQSDFKRFLEEGGRKVRARKRRCENRSSAQRVREICKCYPASFDGGGRATSQEECRRTLEAGKGKGTDSPIVPRRITGLPNSLILGLLTSTTAK